MATNTNPLFAGNQPMNLFGFGQSGQPRQNSMFNFGGAPLQTSLDLSNVAPMPVNPGTTGQAAIMSRLEPNLARQRQQLETSLINQGLRPGGEAYDNAINLLGQQENDARQQAVLQGLTLDQTANQQGFGQALDQGNFGNNALSTQFNQGLSGAQFGYQQQQDQRNIDAAQHNSMMSGLFGLGSSVGAPLLTKALGIGKVIPPASGGGTQPPVNNGGSGGGTLSSIGKLGTAKGLFGLGASTLPVLGAAAGLGAYLWKKSQAHPVANEWVQGEQNPFDQTMNQLNAAVQSGQIQPEQAQQLKVQNAQTYLNELKNFRAQGGKQKTVGDQALATFRQYYGDPSQYGVSI